MRFLYAVFLRATEVVLFEQLGGNEVFEGLKQYLQEVLAGKGGDEHESGSGCINLQKDRVEK